MVRSVEIRALVALAEEHLRAARPDEAVRVARNALALAQGDSEALVASASKILATALLADWEADGPDESFGEALRLLDRAAEMFEHLGTTDFWLVLVILGEVNWRCDNFDTARGIFARVTRDLVEDGLWSLPENASLADHLRGRAFEGLGFLELDEKADWRLALDRFEAATNLFLASGRDDARPHLERIAQVLEEHLDHVDAAKQLRALIRARLG